MTRLFLPYSKTILKWNIFISVFLTFISLLSSKSTSTIVSQSAKTVLPSFHMIIMHYVFWIMTGGLLLSAYYYEITRKNEYYFYYNLGLSRIKLLLLTFLLHLVFISPILIILHYV